MLHTNCHVDDYVKRRLQSEAVILYLKHKARGIIKRE